MSTSHRFDVALLAEWRKLTSTALWWVLGVGMAAYLAFIGGVLAFSITATPTTPEAPATGGVDAALAVYGTLNAIGYVFPLLVGTLLVTTEVRHRTLTQSLLAEPRRSVLLAAKLAVAAPVGLLYGVLGVVGLVATAAPVLGLAGDGGTSPTRPSGAPSASGSWSPACGRCSAPPSAPSCPTRSPPWSRCWPSPSSSSRSPGSG